MYERKEGWVVGWWVDGWKDGWMDEGRRRMGEGMRREERRGEEIR